MSRRLAYLVSFVLVLALAGSVSAELVLHLPFDEGSGTVTEDVSASGLQATLERDFQWTAGMFGQAVAFTDGHAEVSGDPLNLPRITVMAWINPTSIAPDVAANHWSSANNIYGKKGNNGDDSIGLSLTGGNGVLFYADTGADNMLFVLDAGVQTGQWQHIAATFDGTIMRVFLDGEQIGEMAAAGSDSIIEIHHPVRIGGNPDQQNIDFVGAIDDVMVFDQALTTGEIQQAMKGGASGLASDPNPANEAIDVPREAVLNWTPGEFADLHDVYFGTSFDDVNNAAVTVELIGVYRGRLNAGSYAVGERLDLGETYYWRVDEVNAPPDSTVFKGDVWSFATEPVGHPVDGANITATASSSMGGSSPEKTIDGSGLDDSDLHSIDSEGIWLSDMLGMQPTWIEYQFDRVYKLHEMWVWNQNQMIEPAIGYGFQDVSIEYSVDGIVYMNLGTTHEFARAPGAAGYAANTTVDFAGVSAKYVELTPNSNWGGILTQYGLSEVRFFSIPVLAKEPGPASGATDVDVDATLSFRAGREAATHDIYLSTDEQAVIDGIAPVVTVTEPSYASSLDLASTYYWRVDEVNDSETPTTWQGDLWNLSTQEYVVLDDFESYNDIPAGEEGSNLVYMAWIDGFDNPSVNGSTMGYVTGTSLETGNVHDGNKSVPLAYNNTSAGISEVARTFTPAQDWTAHGVKTLSLWFAGSGANVAGQLYVKVNGVQVNYDGDAANLALAGWQTWNIDLTAINTNLSNVTGLTIGIQGPGATGTLLLDDIRLYSYDRQLITPADPGTVGLQAHYEFEGNTNDSSGNARHGTAAGNPIFGEGKVGQAIGFDGLGDYVNIDGYKGVLGSSAITVTAWIKTNSTDTGAIVGWGSNVAGERFGFRVDVGRLRLEHQGGNIQGDTSVNDGAWHHVAVTVRENVTLSYPDVILYLDGADDTRPTTDADPVFNLTAAEDVSIGRRPSVDDRYFIGQIDDVRIYNRALTQEEVTWLAGRTQPFDKPF